MLFKSLDNITLKRMVQTDEHESIEDFMWRVFEVADENSEFYDHIDELHTFYPHICMMCGSRYHDCCGYDNQYGGSFEEGLYRVFQCSAIVNSSCDKCNCVFSATFNKETSQWDKRCRCS